MTTTVSINNSRIEGWGSQSKSPSTLIIQAQEYVTLSLEAKVTVKINDLSTDRVFGASRVTWFTKSNRKGV